jgi:hypothetical protein
VKVACLLDLSAQQADGAIDLEKTTALDDGEVISAFTAIRASSAQVFLIRRRSRSSYALPRDELAEFSVRTVRGRANAVGDPLPAEDVISGSGGHGRSRSRRTGIGCPAGSASGQKTRPSGGIWSRHCAARWTRN